jgi:hypothetical protein
VQRSMLHHQVKVNEGQIQGDMQELQKEAKKMWTIMNNEEENKKLALMEDEELYDELARPKRDKK